MPARSRLEPMPQRSNAASPAAKGSGSCAASPPRQRGPPIRRRTRRSMGPNTLICAGGFSSWRSASPVFEGRTAVTVPSGPMPHRAGAKEGRTVCIAVLVSGDGKLAVSGGSAFPLSLCRLVSRLLLVTPWSNDGGSVATSDSLGAGQVGRTCLRDSKGADRLKPSARQDQRGQRLNERSIVSPRHHWPTAKARAGISRCMPGSRVAASLSPV